MSYCQAKLISRNKLRFCVFPAVLNGTPTHTPENGGSNVSVAPLITMIAVLAIILIFCFCGAPAVREFCRKKVCYCCPEPEDEAGTTMNYNPTQRNPPETSIFIFLPFFSLRTQLGCRYCRYPFLSFYSLPTSMCHFSARFKFFSRKK